MKYGEEGKDRRDGLERARGELPENWIAGPSEGTVIGNLLMQAMALGAFDSLASLRACVAASFPTETFQPEGEEKAWDEAYARLLALGK